MSGKFIKKLAKFALTATYFPKRFNLFKVAKRRRALLGFGMRAKRGNEKMIIDVTRCLSVFIAVSAWIFS